MLNRSEALSPMKPIAGAVCKVVLFLSAAMTTCAGQVPAIKPESPQLAKLAAELEAGNTAALDIFWQQIVGKAPLIEPITGSNNEKWVTFVWRGTSETHAVDLLGEVPTTKMSKWGMRRLGSTDLWFKTERVPKDSRFGYCIRENSGQFRLDPFNPRSFAGRSIVELPDAPPQPWILERPELPKGQLVKTTIWSRVLKEDRALGVYLPAAYKQGAHYGLMLVFDGESYGNATSTVVPTPTILDNLIGERKIKPLVAILINSQKTRDRDLQCSAAFADFLANELVPWAREKYGTSRDAKHVIVGGSSLGGLSAACAAFRRPEVFGNVLSQSGTFSYYPGWQSNATDYAIETGWLTRQFVASPKLPIRFYLEVGIFEGGPIYSLLRENRHLRDVLKAKGYSVSYAEFSGGHDYLTWRNSLGDGLIALTGTKN